jgi:hypothetical protein
MLVLDRPASVTRTVPFLPVLLCGGLRVRPLPPAPPHHLREIFTCQEVWYGDAAPPRQQETIQMNNPPLHRGDVHRDASPNQRPKTPVRSFSKKSTLKRNAKRVARTY